MHAHAAVIYYNTRIKKTFIQMFKITKTAKRYAYIIKQIIKPPF